MRFSVTVKRWVSLLGETETAYLSEAPEFTPIFSGVRVVQFLAFCVKLCRSLFVLLSFFFWSLYCLSFESGVLKIPLVSSNTRVL